MLLYRIMGNYRSYIARRKIIGRLISMWVGLLLGDLGREMGWCEFIVSYFHDSYQFKYDLSFC